MADLDNIVAEVMRRMGIPKLPECETCLGCGECVQKAPTTTSVIVAEGASRISAPLGTTPKNPDIAKYIDHTLLKPEATRADIEQLCKEAKEFRFASVCVNPYWAPLAARMLADCPVKVTVVIGFPLGATSAEVKAFEAKKALEQGADEFDMVINIGALKSGDYDAVLDDIKSVVDAVPGHIVKVIIETALLTDREKIAASYLSKLAGASFVKTSTGFSKGGATVHDVELMRKTVGAELGVKASGGIHDKETLEKMVAAGATRIGASAGVAIVKGESPAKASAY